MRSVSRLVQAITELIHAETTLKRIDAQAKELADYSRGYQAGLEDSRVVFVEVDLDEDQ